MNFLILTQKVDRRDDVLGFMHRWIEEFADHCEQVTVLCLQRGECALPANVRVFSLGKERGVTSRFAYIKNFFRIIWRERATYDKVFVHMNYEYVLLGGVLWRMLGKKIALWYAHGHVPLLLRGAELLAHAILTSTKSGFRLSSTKVRVIGQGIDTHFFSPPESQTPHDDFRIVVVGRMSPVKNYETLIDAMAVLHTTMPQLRVTLVGGAPLLAQEQYVIDLKQRVVDADLESVVSFIGARSNTDIVQILRSSDLFVNTSLTGSLDKAVLEAMSCGVPILTCNESLSEVLGILSKEYMFQPRDIQALCHLIASYAAMSIDERRRRGAQLRQIVVDHHDVRSFVQQIIHAYE